MKTPLTLSAVPALLALTAISAIASPDPKTLFFALNAEPPQLNSAKSTDTIGNFMLGHLMEGLTAYGKKEGEVIPGVAEKWELTDTEATFHLRKTAKWSDGKPVTAQDFVTAWKVVLDPKTASEYAFILYPIKNAEAINAKGMAATQLGAVAVDDYTLKVTLEKPCGYFIGLTAMATYLPIREDFYQAHKDRFGADASEMLYNGPFMLTKWVHGAELQMDRNPNYWNKEKIKIDRISVPYITADTNTQFNLFKNKKIDVMERLSKSDLEKAMQERLKINSFPDGSIWYMEFNFRAGRMTTNKNLRQAIAALYNPSEFVNQIVGIPKTKPATGFIPTWVAGINKTFREENKRTTAKPDPIKAKLYLAAAMKELKLSSPPSLVWLTQDTELAKREAEYFQKRFKEVLGINLKIDQQIFKQRLAKMTSGDFDIVSAGWGPDFADPMTFAELKATWNENNRGRWSNEKYDELIRKAQSTANKKIRMESMAAAEKIMLEDVAVLPTFERTQVYLRADRVEGMQRHAIGPDPYFVYATVK